MKAVAVCLVACAAALLSACQKQPVVSQTDPSRPTTSQPPDGKAPATPRTQAATPPAPPPTQTRVPAKQGETCMVYFKGCIDWCTTNMSGSADCLNYCREQFSTCNVKGEWSMDNNTKVIYGMPPK